METYPCCMGVAAHGADYCTCWTPIYDLDQSAQLDLDARTPVRPRCCHDCAYRADSREWADDGERERLEGIPYRGAVFFCHEGMRRIVRWEHELAPPGLVIPAGPGDYRPPIRGGRAYRADGRPALICGGFAARAGADRLALILDELHKATLREQLHA